MVLRKSVGRKQNSSHSRWTPKFLEPVPDKKAIISRGDSIGQALGFIYEKVSQMWNGNEKNCAIKVEGAGYGIVMSSDENKLFGGRIGKPKVAICPKCGEVSIYVEDVEKL